jgi:hypothetical protein
MRYILQPVNGCRAPIVDPGRRTGRNGTGDALARPDRYTALETDTASEGEHPVTIKNVQYRQPRRDLVRTVDCPYERCHAAAGEACRRANGTPRVGHHQRRVQAYQKSVM